MTFKDRIASSKKAERRACTRSRLLAGTMLAGLVATACQQTPAQVTSVELLGAVTANQASNGLGFNLDPGQDWQWAAAAAAGATYARIQCSWSKVEQQTKPPANLAANPRYVQDPACTRGFVSARKYGIHPTVVAAFGPPFHPIVTVSLSRAAQSGDTSLSVAFVTGIGGDTLTALKVPYDYIMVPGAKPITAQHSYQGSLIAGIKVEDRNHASITLASALKTPLAAATQLTINEILYPSTATERANDPSVIAYGDYVAFLASDMAAHGVKGEIELWNEPPWAGDPWDNRCLLYDKEFAASCLSLPGAPSSPYQPNYGFVANLQRRKLPPGITLTWNGTAGSGWASILGPRMYAESGENAVQPAMVVTKESFHPYGFEPEQMMWTTGCLRATVAATTKAGRDAKNCYLPGEPTTSNYLWAAQADMIAKNSNPAYGIGHEITETGVLPPEAGLQVQQARFVIRQFLGFQADGVTPVEFFKLFSREVLSDPNFSFVEEVGSTPSFTPNPSYTALSGFMADIRPISSLPPAPYAADRLPSVVTYRGTFPLTTVHMSGARAGATANSDAFMVWQRSFVKCASPGHCDIWMTQAPPASAPVTINIPISMKVTQVINLTTRTKVSYTTSGRKITFPVSDDPIEVLVDPS